MTTTTATDYYALLGVDPGATTAQIKSAYRKLAKHYHPDVNDSSDAAEKFREITEAYDTLTDPTGAAATTGCTAPAPHLDRHQVRDRQFRYTGGAGTGSANGTSRPPARS